MLASVAISKLARIALLEPVVYYPCLASDAVSCYRLFIMFQTRYFVNVFSSHSVVSVLPKSAKCTCFVSEFRNWYIVKLACDIVNAYIARLNMFGTSIQRLLDVVEHNKDKELVVLSFAQTTGMPLCTKL